MGAAVGALTISMHVKTHGQLVHGVWQNQMDFSQSGWSSGCSVCGQPGGGPPRRSVFNLEGSYVTIT
jgi:hypothetical protein